MGFVLIGGLSEGTYNFPAIEHVSSSSNTYNTYPSSVNFIISTLYAFIGSFPSITHVGLNGIFISTAGSPMVSFGHKNFGLYNGTSSPRLFLNIIKSSEQNTHCFKI